MVYVLVDSMKIIRIEKIADYWRVIINGRLQSTHTTKAEALASLKDSE